MRLRLVLVGLFFALMFAYAGANAYLALSTLRTSSPRGWIVQQRGGRVLITHVDPEGPASALQAGDEIISLTGQLPENLRLTAGPSWPVKPGSFYTIVVRRGGEVREFTLRTEPFSPSWWAAYLLSTLIVPAVFLFTGLVVFSLKPDDKQALLFALMYGMVIYPGLLLYSLVGSPWWLTGVLIVGFTVTNSFLYPLIFHFFLVFPERSPVLGRFPRLEYGLYLPVLAVHLPFNAISSVLFASAPERAWALSYSPFGRAVSALETTYIAAGLVSLVITYRQASQLSRRKLRVVLAGTVVGVSPMLLLSARNIILRVPFNISGSLRWLYAAANIVLLLVPLAFAYAMVRHQVIPVSLIIRRGVQYLLAKNALRVTLALPVIGLVLTIVSNPNRTVAEILFRNSIHFYLLLIAAVALGLVFRRRLREWVDRKFFREAYNQEKILGELIDDVRNLDSMVEMSRLVSRKVDSALHPESIYLFYRNEVNRDLSLGYSSGAASQELRIPEEFQLLRLMENQGKAQDFPFRHKDDLPQGEREWLAGLGTRLIVPMSGMGSYLAGLLLLGEKKSEVPYTARDRELLETLADQIAIVYENVRLKRRVDSDREIKRVVLLRFEEEWNLNLLKECPTCGTCFNSSAQFCTRDKSELTLSLPVERTIEARYRLDRLIGKGGMGAVYEAADLRLNRKVAVKILSGSMFGDRKALRRFAREAQASARLNHPNIIAVHDYGELATEGAFLVMDLIEGESLGAAIRREGCIHPRVAARWFDQVLEGVEAAHGAGVVHRDLKPENILITKEDDGETLIKILDFGLAKVSAPDLADTGSLTASGTLVGTLAYMSPEQLTGEEVDERGDIFSLGVTVVEALTGRRPFNGRTLTELMTSVMHDTYHLPGESEEVGRLDKILQRCLAKDRAERYASAGEMQKELIPAMRACPPFSASVAATWQAETIEMRDPLAAATLRDGGGVPESGVNAQETVIDETPLEPSS